MGRLRDHPIQDYVTQLGLNAFVETGTGPQATGIRHAMRFPFRELHSIEALGTVYSRALEEMNRHHRGDTRWTLHCSESHYALAKLVPQLAGRKVLWWLDAHYPQNYGNACSVPRTPLLLELGMIRALRRTESVRQDAFIIDDWRMYGGEAINGPLPAELESAACDRDAVLRHLQGTGHAVIEDRRAEGYLIALPDGVARPQ